MQTTWIVAADEHRVRIFEMEGKQSNFREIEDFINPEARLAERDLNTDAKGRYFGSGGHGMGHTSEPNVSATQHTTEVFSKSIGAYLDKARMERRYDKLRLIAFPKFLGALRKHLSKEAQQMVEDEVSKNISNFEPRQIEEYIKVRLH
ncbi:MAG TPA: host attachment protein [Oxalicibacterium sp.]|jgi:protein required for attachment to host cells|nr:host attachment protein [Oxalicibacterium sp.]